MALAVKFQQVPQGRKLDLLIWIFAQLAGVTTNPETLMQNAVQFQRIPEGSKMNVLLWIACNIMSTGGGGGTNACLIAQSGGPGATPCAQTFGLAYDNDKTSSTAGRFWFWSINDNQWIPFSV